MNTSLIRNDYFLGNNKIIVGQPSTDLVLETLGKIYIKYGNNTFLLNTIFKSLNTSSEVPNLDIVTIVDDIANIDFPGNNKLIYDKKSQILYLCIDNLYLELINTLDFTNPRYVKKSGDTMTGVLEIKTSEAPLKIQSKDLIQNLNSEFLSGKSEKAFAHVNEDDTINGNWTFLGNYKSLGPWKFNNITTFLRDVIFYNSIQSSLFASGFSGYGWKLDNSTNTLTIDNLLVRKALKVYELIINLILATNGSIWVTNAEKCKNSYKPIVINLDYSINNTDIKIYKDNKFINLQNNKFYLFSNIAKIYNILGNNLSSPSKSGKDTLFIVYDYIFKIINADVLNNNSEFTLEDLNTLIYNIDAETPKPFKFNSAISCYPLRTNLPKDTIDSLKPFSSFPIILDNKLIPIFSYFKYFGSSLKSLNKFNNNYWIIEIDSTTYPHFKCGDILRCQKFKEKTIKYYDLIIVKQLDTYTYLTQISPSVFDQYSLVQEEDLVVKENSKTFNNTITKYNENTEKFEDFYLGSQLDEEDKKPYPSKLDVPTSKDELVLIGNILDVNRLNAIYITSSDDLGPYLDVISGLNRPDYLVIYYLPKYLKYKHTDGKYYYVSETFNSTFLGEFEITDTNNIIPKPLNPEPAIQYKKLYGYTYPIENSLILLNENLEPLSLATKSTKVRLGNLSGIYNSEWKDKLPLGYGLYGENVYLTGEFYLNNGKSIVEFSEDLIMLKFNNAGLYIKKDAKGRDSIQMNAESFYFFLNNDDGSTETLPILEISKNELGQKIIKINGDLLDINGWIQSNGLKIGYTDSNGKFIPNFIVNTEGEIEASNAFLKGAIVSDSGYLGGIIEEKSYEGFVITELCKYYKTRLTDHTIGDLIITQENTLILNPKIYINKENNIYIYKKGFYVNDESISCSDLDNDGKEAFFDLYSVPQGFMQFLYKDSLNNKNFIRVGLEVFPASGNISAMLGILKNNYVTFNNYGAYIDLSNINPNENKNFAALKLNINFDPNATDIDKNKFNYAALDAKGNINIDGRIWMKADTSDLSGEITTPTYISFSGSSNYVTKDDIITLPVNLITTLPDLDKIRLRVLNGLIVGWKKE